MYDKKLKIYGLIRSGTNFLEFLIRNNFGFAPMVNEGAWKHGKISYDLDADVVIIYKDIYAWLYSIHKYSLDTDFFKNGKVNLSEFIKSNFLFVENDAKLESTNPITFFNECHDHYLKADTKRKKIFIKYDEILSNTGEQLQSLATSLDVPFDVSQIVYPIRQILPHETANLPAQKKFDYNKKNFYEQKKYMKFFNQADQNFINSQLDHAVVKKLNEKSL
jgi:hypothetical protein